MNIMKLQRFGPVINHSRIKTARFGDKPLWFRPFTVIKVAEGFGLVEDETLAQKKRELYQALEGTHFNSFCYSFVILSYS
jgi:hypothetical protein